MAKVRTLVLVGVEVKMIEVETFIGNGFSGLNILGIGGDHLRDLRERVRSVLELCGIPLPSKRIVVNLSPSDLLPMSRTPLCELEFAVAAAVVIALEAEKGKIQQQAAFYCGSLSLSGEIKPVSNILLPLFAVEAFPQCLVYVGEGPKTTMQVRPSFKAWLQNREPIPCNVQEHSAQVIEQSRLESIVSVVRSLETAPRSLVALFAATAGGLNTLLAGDPGVGKSYALKFIPQLLPPLTRKESMEQQLICGNKIGMGLSSALLPSERPFRAPHHTCTAAALVGGASLRPGEVTLAHGGCLFLDELGEFPRASLEALREPLDEGKVRLSKAGGEVRYPAQFLLCAATNPCPCGFLLSRKRGCRCNASESRAYVKKFSGPLLDRFAIQLLVGEGGLYEDTFARVVAQDLEAKAYEKLAMRLLHAQRHALFAKANAVELPPNLASGTSRRGQLLLSQLAFTLNDLFPEVPMGKDFWGGVVSYRQLDGLLSEKYV